MHGRGSQAGAPTSDAVGRGDSGGTPQTVRLSHVVARGGSRLGPMRANEAKIGADAVEISADAAEIGVDAAQIWPTQSVSAVSACIGRNGRVRPKFKKKKKGANAPFINY